MVSDQEIANCVETLLREQSSDPANAGAAVSLTGVVKLLESKLGTDLSDKTNFIRDQIDLILGPPRSIDPQFLLQQQQLMMQQGFGGSNFNQMLMMMGGVVPQEAGFSRYAARVAPVVAVAPPRQYAHGPVEPGARPIGSVLDAKESAPVAKRRGGPGGLSKMCGVSPELQAIVGEPTMPRTEIVKQLWAYIRKNNLQDPDNKRIIICNDELKLVFETDCTDMFKMNKLLAKHILPLEDPEDVEPDPKKLKIKGVDTANEQPTVISDSKQPLIQTCNGQPVVISDALANFLGTEEKEMLQSDALERILAYIKDNKLEDPGDHTMVQCDSRLQQLFGCLNLSTVVIPETLACHLSRKL